MIEGTVSGPESPLEVVRVPMFSDNYGWILRDASSGVVAVVDPGEAAPIQRVLETRFVSIREQSCTKCVFVTKAH
jgi:glyoxylase-like metal-dependent hydrolase (beta-lactamase superfamily II)